MIKTRVHLYISGKVQGVFFRVRATERALRLGVTGWIRNLPDGRVEAVFEGDQKAVEAAVEFCRKGPSRAVVEKVEAVWGAYTGEFGSFKVKHR